MLELVALLLPLAAASGWYIARRDMRKQQRRQRPDLSSDYFKGLNFLLNEQPDKAIEVFIQMLEVDSETVETHLALGNLFRRRGEVDRAIRIHQNIIARPTLSRNQRSLALYELGQDYMRAGLLDRAENLFQELIELGEYKPEALRQLLDVYEQEKDWSKAVDTARSYEFVTGKDTHSVIAHYYCEQAEVAMSRHDMRAAQQAIKKALSVDRACVRASLLRGQIESSAGDCTAAIRAYRTIESQDAGYISEAVAPLEKCYRAIGRLAEYRHYLEGLLEQYGGVTVMLALSELIKAEQGERAAIQFIIEQLRKRPSVRGLERLVEYTMHNTEGPARENMQILSDLVTKLSTLKPLYKCQACGFEAKAMHWHCPSCKRWNSVKPLQDIVEN